MRDPALLQQRPQRLARHQPFLRRQLQARTMQQRHHYFPDACIEAERGKLQHAARLVHPQLLLQQLRQVAHTRMFDHHPLGKTGRARGVDHIRKIR